MTDHPYLSGSALVCGDNINGFAAVPCVGG